MSYSLLLLLKGPMQSWGDESRYHTRATASTPSKSGVVGLLAAAQGRRRMDPIEDLAGLRIAVRVDQAGSLMKDFQTARPWQKNPTDNPKLVTRFYLSDAAFLVAVEHDDREFLESIAAALRDPKYPLFLGRRSCPAPANLLQGIVEGTAEEALMGVEQWFASKAHKRERAKDVKLPIYRDARPGEHGDRRQDVPISFASNHREYGWREVVFAGSKEIENHDGSNTDPFFEAVIRA
ncbi:type I-E CRISPR-associated protein Cas5/CasD [Corynebacterium phoceense]|uniref:type I-E CRISPR-associated protein Cas5/CasD n=1 Tax=Corynebacterium phoceense TaxID=1686286 RepID=UPI00211C7186|nr:type I-E CRISPR-associated protein Cas5/CasD [Corynebacterium phoceense]MCQ9336129.1 type I-E CRISPR-associated protein Cas5/CasD [Corynebacterium phoceense]